MLHTAVSAVSASPAGRHSASTAAAGAKAWRILDVYAAHRRDADSHRPRKLFRGTCITWTSSVIAVGWDFAETLLQEQRLAPASRDHLVEVAGGRPSTWRRRLGLGLGRVRPPARYWRTRSATPGRASAAAGALYWSAGAA
ncbi:MAG: hypothetical protein U0797_00155 [Gemmataceae bacterium]